MSDYKPKTRKSYDTVYCVFCHKEIRESSYHYIKSRSAGLRPVCTPCAVGLGLLKGDEYEKK